MTRKKFLLSCSLGIMLNFKMTHRTELDKLMHFGYPSGMPPCTFMSFQEFDAWWQRTPPHKRTRDELRQAEIARQNTDAAFRSTKLRAHDDAETRWRKLRVYWMLQDRHTNNSAKSRYGSRRWKTPTKTCANLLTFGTFRNYDNQKCSLDRAGASCYK